VGASVSEKSWYEVRFYIGPTTEDHAREVGLGILALPELQCSGVWLDELKVMRAVRVPDGDGEVSREPGHGYTRRLTRNERKLALTLAEREGGETRRWMNLVLEAYDACDAERRVADAERDRLAEALRRISEAPHNHDVGLIAEAALASMEEGGE
jgi:hypothetical protein